jgi:iron complex outermembrane recepter protein
MNYYISKVIFMMSVISLVITPLYQIEAGEGNPTSFSYIQREYGSIHGIVRDAETNSPIMFATIRLKDIGRHRISREDGTFQFDAIPVRKYTITVQHIGYVPIERDVDLVPDDTLLIDINLTPSIFEITESVVVTGTGRERGISDAYQPTSVLGGLELQRKMQTTLPSSLTHLPGISQQSFGAAATQPVIRGMGGDRVLVLEDGQRTGDLSTTAADHTVAIEPVTAERVEVIRGPAGLLYGSNALGGVINIIREEIPRNLPERITGTLTVRGESYNNGYSGGGMITVPAGAFSIRGEASGRIANDIRTPKGMLPSTDLKGYNISGGISRITDWGYIGTSFRQYELRYGVPGEFNGVLIPGAHTGGVEIEFMRRVGRLKAIHYDGIGWFSDIELDAHLTNYNHLEIEGETGDGRPVVGAEFEQLSTSVSLVARHVHDNGDIRTEGAAGLAFRYRDLLSIRGFTGTRSAREIVASAYIYEEFAYKKLRVQAGLRFDWTDIKPYRYDPIRTGQRLLPVNDRRFNAFSGSIALLHDITPGWKIGAGTSRAFRPPAIEELYSDGPHLADFSFDIGNPELDEEIGTGIDLFLRGEGRRLKTDLNIFYNYVSNYIYYEPTGEIDPRLRRYPVFQARADNAIFYGAEGKLEWIIWNNIVVDATLSYVHAARTIDADPLPFIPPLNGNANLRYEVRKFFATIGYSGAAPQNRVPSAIPDPMNEGEMIKPQSPTPSYDLLGAGMGYRWTKYKILHTITLNIENAVDTVWRDHLSRVKDVAPQPGRNIRLSYQLLF